MTLDPRNILLWIISLANVAFGLFIFLKDRRNIINRSFGGFAIAIALWSFSVLIFRTTLDGQLAIFAIKFSYVSALLIGMFFLTFSIAFPAGQRLKNWVAILLWLTTLAQAFSVFRPSFLTKQLIYRDWGKAVVLGISEYILFFVWFVSTFFGGLLIIWRKLKSAQVKIEHVQLSYIFWSVLIAGTGGVIFNLFLPSPIFNEWRFIWLGPIFTFLIVLFIAYAIAKHRLLNIKAIATEVLAMTIIVALAIELFLSTTITEIIFRFLILSFVAVSGYLLVKSVTLEVRQREEVQKLAVALQAANDRLQELDKQKTEFLSIASHQLRTPLSIIKGYVSMTLEGDYGHISPAAVQALENVYSSNEHLVHLVDEFLDVTRMETGRTEFNFQPTDLGKLVAEVAGELKANADIKKLKFVTEIAKVPSLKIDSERIRHVIFNFIDNAIKYTEKGVITIKLAKEKNTPAVVFTVTDTGLGMDESDRKNLFQKFYRGQNVKATNVNGTGLGLFVCRKFIEVHQGEIWVASPGLGQGSTFGFRLFVDPVRSLKTIHHP